MKIKITFLRIAAFVFSLSLSVQASPLIDEKIVTDTSAFIFAGIYNDSMVHIVWDRSNQITNATYILEKSTDNGVNYTEVKKIIDNNTLVDIKQINKSLINRYGNILYSTEAGYMRFMYNEFIGSINNKINFLYRVRIEISEELILYTESVNCSDSKNGLPGNHGNVFSAQGQPAPPTPQACPGIGNPPSGYNNTGVTNTYSSNCCNITEKKYQQSSTSCQEPSNSPCTQSDPADCACSCTYDDCCQHSCSDFNICFCVPWKSCTPGSAGNVAWIVTAVTPVGNNPSAGSNVSICLGEATTLNGSGGSSYSWSPASSLSNPNISNPSASPNSTTTYTLTAPSSNGCSGTDVVTVFVYPSINANAGSNVSICLGEATTLNGSGGASYSWSPASSLSNPNISNPSASPNSTTTYTLTATSSNGCSGTDVVTVFVYPSVNANAGPNENICLGESVTLNANGGVSYSWSPAGDLSDPNISNPSASPNVTKTYTVTITDSNGCSETDDVIVFVHPIPAPDFTISLSCVGQTTNFTDQSTISSGIIASWSWDFGDGSPLDNNQNPTHIYTTTGNYTVTLKATSDQGCIQSTSFPVIVHPVPTAVFTNNSVCLNFPTLFNDQSSVNGGTVVSWAWDFGDGTPAGTAQNPSHMYSADGSYFVTLSATSNNGCTSSAIQPVIVHPLPVSSFTVDDSAGCIEHCVNFTDLSSVTSGTINNWVWNFGDTLGGSGAQVVHCYPTPGTYTITLITTTNNGCSDTLVNNSMITAYPLPVAGFTGDPLVTTVLTPTVKFYDESSGATQWQYNFGDGSPVDNSQAPSHLFPDYNDADHSYIVEQLVTNQWGCTDTISITIIIKPDYTFYIPNSFTPNGDGKNDYYYGSGIGIIDYKMSIFDRWGNLIWTCKTLALPQESPLCKWDGKVEDSNRDNIQQDVYVWQVQLTDVFKKKHEFIGHVTIVR